MGETKKNTPRSIRSLHGIHAEIFDIPMKFRKEVMEKCHWSYSKYYRAVNKKYQPSPAEIKQIQAIAAKYPPFTNLTNL